MKFDQRKKLKSGNADPLPVPGRGKEDSRDHVFIQKVAEEETL